MTFNLKQLEAFVSVADLRSFRRAADALNTTQPNISARIAALETRLGISLMDRDAGSVRLSPTGTTLLPYAREVLRSLDRFVVAAGDDALFQGVLRLGVTELVVHTWLGAFLKALKERFPNVLVELNVDFSANISEGLFNRSVDLAFQSGPFDRPISGVVDLGSYPMTWVAAPSLGFRSPNLELADLARYPVLISARGTMPYQQLAEHAAANRTVGVKLVPSTNLAACLQMTIDGLGVACLPRAMTEDPVAHGKLVELAYPWVPDPLRFQARYNAETMPSYVAEAARLGAELSGAVAPLDK